MNVRDIFELRKQGKIEEAYEAIRPIYKEHKGKYTTLCMFWTAADVFKLRVQQKRFYEATKIFQALRRVLPNIDDKDGHAAGFMHFAGSQLGLLRRDSTTAPTGSPAVSPIATVLAASPSSSSSLHFSCENAPAPAGSPGLAPAGSPGPAPAGSPASTVLSDSVAEGLNPGQQTVLDSIKADEGINVPRISEATNIPSKSIERHISVLIERRLIEHRGSKKTGGYHVVTNE